MAEGVFIFPLVLEVTQVLQVDVKEATVCVGGVARRCIVDTNGGGGLGRAVDSKRLKKKKKKTGKIIIYTNKTTITGKQKQIIVRTNVSYLELPPSSRL